MPPSNVPFVNGPSQYDCSEDVHVSIEDAGWLVDNLAQGIASIAKRAASTQTIPPTMFDIRPSLWDTRSPSEHRRDMEVDFLMANPSTAERIQVLLIGIRADLDRGF
ncbi:hypothetical protein BFW01_g11765 [Lasiodiplodia theobromae]|nr:hypothetical protein BFW01_g11765 [Lasiodiplodia theobromae]